MPVTRSQRSLAILADSATTTSKPRHPKRQVRYTDIATPTPKKPLGAPPSTLSPSTLSSPALPVAEANQLLPAVLSFSFETAKQHLITVDARFEGIFNKLPCRPFEQLETVDPFRTLVTSILGQQISWLAARSITHKFIRLYFPSLPEKPTSVGAGNPKDPQLFPTPRQVVETDIITLKSAGLSTRKAEYVQDLASRFADGRLTSQKLLEADDEELSRMLIEVRGIGRWTVDMFAIFSLRRPDILPVGDLGVQRGIIRWFLSLHSPKDAITISSKKLLNTPGTKSPDRDAISTGAAKSFLVAQAQSETIIPSSHSNPTSAAPVISDIPSIPVTPTKDKSPLTLHGDEEISGTSENPLHTGSTALLPEPFTPSINRVLHSGVSKADDDSNPTEIRKMALAPLPEGLTVISLKNRLNGKKTKGALLTPKEMEDLTELWRPYRSLGVYYMWALAEESSSK